MPFMRVRRGKKLYNYTRGPNGKPTGKPHGVFPNNANGKKRADAQLGILWAAYRRETKAMQRYKDINFKPPASLAATARQALDAGNEISGVTRSLAFHEPLTAKTVRQLQRRFKREVKDWTPFGGEAIKPWVQGVVATMDLRDQADKAARTKAVKAVDYDQLVNVSDRLHDAARRGAANWGILAGQFADKLDQAAAQAERPNDLRLRAAAGYSRRAGGLRLGGPRTFEQASRLLDEVTNTLKQAKGSAMPNHKSETSANVGFAIPDDDVTGAKFYKGAEVYIKSLNEIGVVKAVAKRRKGIIYQVATRSSFAVCTAKDMVFAGKSAMKALKAHQPALAKLAAPETPLQLGDVEQAIQAMAVPAKAVDHDNVQAALQSMRSLKAAWAILRANAKATDVAKTFIKAAVDALGDAPDVEAPVYEGEATEDVAPTQQEAEPVTDPPTTPPASPVLQATQSLVSKIKAIKAAGTVTKDDEDELLDHAEVLRAYTQRDGGPEQMAALADVEEAIYGGRESGMQAWSDKVLGMVDQYQKQIAQVV